MTRIRRSKTKPAIIDAKVMQDIVIGLICAIAFVALWLGAWLY